MQSALIVSAILASVLVLTQGAATPEQLKARVDRIAKDCVTSSKIPADKAKIVFTQDIPANEAEKCFLECVYSGVQLISGQKFNLDGAKKLINDRFTGKEATLANTLVETCNREIVAKADEKCSLGRAVRECFVKNGKTVNFFPNKF